MWNWLTDKKLGRLDMFLFGTTTVCIFQLLPHIYVAIT